MKILQSLCVLLVARLWKHTEASITKVLKQENGNDAPMAALTSLISGCDTF
jgi:hypothetical protein